MQDTIVTHGLELFMENLKQLIYSNNNPLINNHPSILSQRSQFQLLYEELGSKCPDWLITSGIKIARNCHGLPLAVVVIAGILEKEAVSKDSWERIAQSVSSNIVSERNRYVETLALSYELLPRHLRDCFLYLGGFPEDYMFPVRRLILLWVAEGFVQEAGNRSLEEIAEDYLMELIDRNLLIVTKRKFSGGVKGCKLHDLVREICLEKATEESFSLKISTCHRYETITVQKHRRLFTDTDAISSGLPIPTIRSFLFHERNVKLFISSAREYLHTFALLMVLNLQDSTVRTFPRVIGLLVHLRYLAIWYVPNLYSSISNLWNLQTLIVHARDNDPLVLPKNISKLENLRHFWSKKALYFPSVEKPMNLQTISNVMLGDGAESWLKCFPNIKKLTCTLYSDEENDFESLTYLETLKLTGSGRRKKPVQQECPKDEPKFQKNHIRFPATLKKLTLLGCRLPWRDMSIIQSLSNLDVLKLLDNAFEGPKWYTGEEQFRQLKFLKLQNLDIQRWEASSINFPCLKRLVLVACPFLEEIPLEIGDISTLELIETSTLGLIETDSWNLNVVKSLARIQEEQHRVGNYELKINVNLYVERVLREYRFMGTWQSEEMDRLDRFF